MNIKIKPKDFFPESLGPKCGYKYTWQNTLPRNVIAGS